MALVAGRRTHDLPASTRPALAALLEANELKVGDLPGLEPVDRLTLARRLVTGAVAVVPDAVAGRGAGSVAVTVDHGGRGDSSGAGG